MRDILYKYVGSLFWAIRNKKRLGGIKIRLTNEGWCVCMPEIILSMSESEGK
jgi:hypothetical protein